MILFATKTKDEFDGLKAYITAKVGVGIDVNYIISGVWSGAIWLTYDPAQVPLYIGAATGDTFGTNCMKIRGNGTHLFTERFACAGTLPSICELP